MANEQLELLYKFMCTELASMKDSIKSNYVINIENRKNNDFLLISDETMKKYMALGRSVDSQLGNRMQRIIFYVARMRYGILNVPNIVSIDISNEVERNIKVTVYSVPFDLNKDEQRVGFNPYSQSVIVSKNLSIDRVKELLNVKKKTDKLLCQTFEFGSVSEPVFNKIRNGRKIPVDLLILDIGENTISRATAFEIKMGGNLDTKNAKSNAQEVKDLSSLFSFLGDSQSYFATCYGECSAAVKKELDTILNRNSVLNGLEFWKKILPNSFTYDEFIEKYKDAFIKSSLEKELKSL